MAGAAPPTVNKAEFEAVLTAYLGVDAGPRNEAVAYLSKLSTSQPDLLMMSLLQSMRSCAVPALRSLSAVLIRKALFQSDHMWTRLSAGARAVLKSELILAVEGEPDESICRIACDTVGEMGRMTMADEPWPELLSTLFRWVTGADMKLRGAAMKVFETLAGYLAEQRKADFPTFLNIFGSCLKDPKSTRTVRLNTVRALGTLIAASEFSKDTLVFRPVIPVLLQLIEHLLKSNDDEGAEKVVSVMIDIAEDHVEFFATTLSDVALNLLKIADSKRCGDRIRQLSLEWTVTFAEKAPPLARKMGNNSFVVNTLPVVFSMMLEVEDDKDWDKTEGGRDRQLSNPNVALEALQHLAEAIKWKRFSSVASAFITNFLKKDEWRYRHAALMGLSRFVEIMPNKKEQLGSLAALVVPYVKDPHPRVQYAAVTAIGMMCYHHHPGIQVYQHATLVPAIEAAMQSPSPRVQGHAAASLVNFAESADDEVLEPYVLRLLERLFGLVRDGLPFVQYHAMNAIGVLADMCPLQFSPIFDRMMPLLDEVLSRCSGKETRRLEGRTIETMSTLGSAVESTKFKPFAVGIMKRLLTEQERGKLAVDDPIRAYMWGSYGRIARALGADFAPYLKVVMPALLQGAQVDALVTEADDDSDDSDIEEVQDHSRRALRVRTSALGDKEEAVRMLANLAAELKGNFLEYVAPVADVVVPMIEMDNVVYDDIKTLALSTVASLCACISRGIVSGDRAPVGRLLRMVLGPVIKSMLASSNDMESLMTHVQTLKMAIEDSCLLPDTPDSVAAMRAAGADELPRFQPLLTKPELLELSKLLLRFINESKQRRTIILSSAKVATEWEEEDREYDMFRDMREVELQYYCVECVNSLFKSHTSLYQQAFVESKMLEKALNMSHIACTEEDRKHGLFMLVDSLEFGGMEAAAYLPQYTPILQACAMDSKSAALRQAAAYGIGVGASALGTRFKPSLNACLETLGRVIGDTQKRTDDERAQIVHDTAVSALGKIIMSQPVDLPRLVPMWLSCLPLETDFDEARVVCRQLCSRIESGCKEVLNPEASRLPRALHALAYTCSKKGIVTKNLAYRIASTLRRLQAQSPAVLEAASAAIPGDVKKVFHVLLSDESLVAAPAGRVAAGASLPGSPIVVPSLGGSGAGGGAGAGSQ